MIFVGGVAWSSGQRRSLSLQGSADRIPVVLFLVFVLIQKEELFVMRRNVRARKGPATKRDDERGGGEKKKKNRQAFLEWLREKGFRFVSKTIKWSTPITRNDMERKNNVLLYFTRST